MRVVRVSATDATRHVLCWPDVDEAPARQRKVHDPAGMRALVDVISASVSKEQTCNRWLCSAAMSGMGMLPRLSSPSEVIAPAGEHGKLVAWLVESS